MKIRHVLFGPRASGSRPDIEAVRLLDIVAGFTRSAVIAAHPEMGADPRDDDDPIDPSTLTALCVLEIVQLLENAVDRYVETAKREERRRSYGLPF